VGGKEGLPPAITDWRRESTHSFVVDGTGRSVGCAQGRRLSDRPWEGKEKKTLAKKEKKVGYLAQRAGM